ncbi:integrase core domain-containing protein [Sorangium sp. So ce388]
MVRRFKGHFALGDKTRCHPLTLTDQASRYLLKCEGVAKPDEASVRPHFERAFHEFGLPNRIRSDNGPPFATLGVGGLSALSVSWIKLGVAPERIEPGKPQQNGRHERMHKTLKAEATSPPQATLAAQQRVFDRFRREYNDRPGQPQEQGAAAHQGALTCASSRRTVRAGSCAPRPMGAVGV